MILGGILNTLSFFLHVLLGYQIHQLSELSEAHRSLLGAFNIGGSLCIFFFAYVSFFQQKDLLETKLGHAVLALATLLYTVRALEELVLFKFDWVIFASCLVVAVIYAVALGFALKRHAAVVIPIAA
jgi:putative effector of murein hydrolase